MQHDAINKRWFRKIGSAAAPKLQLFCFPYGGSGPGAYRSWQNHFGDQVELTGILYPGREARIADPLMIDIKKITASLLPSILPRLHRPFAFFGHSMGALISFELTRMLQAANKPMPSQLIVSGTGAPHIPERDPIHHLPDQEFMQAVIDLNGLPPEVLANRELLAYALPVIRADFTACETYEFDQQGGKIGCPLTVFGGSKDPLVEADDFEQWEQHAGDEYQLQMFDGDHFFIDTHRDQVLSCVQQRLDRVLVAA